MSVGTRGRSVHPGSGVVLVALAIGMGGEALVLTLGFSPVSVSLLGAAMTALGWWAFASEP